MAKKGIELQPSSSLPDTLPASIDRSFSLEITQKSVLAWYTFQYELVTQPEVTVKGIRAAYQQAHESPMTRISTSPLHTEYGDFVRILVSDAAQNGSHTVLMPQKTYASLADAENVSVSIVDGCDEGELFTSKCRHKEDVQSTLQALGENQEGGIFIHVTPPYGISPDDTQSKEFLKINRAAAAQGILRLLQVQSIQEVSQKSQLQGYTLHEPRTDAETVTPLNTTLVKMRRFQRQMEEQPWVLRPIIQKHLEALGWDSTSIIKDQTVETRQFGTWQHQTIFDHASNVVHHSLLYNPTDKALDKTATISYRPHCACETSERFGADNCDCKEQLRSMLELALNDNTDPIVVHFLGYEGRALGIVAKGEQYLQMKQMTENGVIIPRIDPTTHEPVDTVQAYLYAGYPASEARDYSVVKKLLEHQGIKNATLRMHTDNMSKVKGIADLGIPVKQISHTMQLKSVEALNALKARENGGLGHTYDKDYIEKQEIQLTRRLNVTYAT